MNNAAGTPLLTPIGARDRIVVLDVLRGFALLGIFLMNIEWFSRPMQEMGRGIPADATGPDYVAAWLVYVFVQGKFWVLFSLLFGMGFAVMAGRGGRDGNFNRVYIRRCVALLVFGGLHIVLLWSGDILHTYALAGLVLLALATLGNRLLFWVGLLGYAGVAGMILLNGVALYFIPLEEMGLGDFLAQIEAGAVAAAGTYATGGFLEVAWQRVRDWGMIGLQANMLLVPAALFVFMLGAWLLRSGHMDGSADSRRFHVRLALVGLTVGGLLTAVGVAFGVSFPDTEQMGLSMLAMAVLFVGALPLSLGYIAMIVLGMGVPGVSKILSWLAPAGRMALTNYLMQSLVASLVFFGYGLGMWGQVGRAGQVAMVFGVFALQVVCSHLWLSRFRFGPMEWLWRWLSYGERPPMRHAHPAT